MYQHANNAQSGFTLLELMIVVAIVGILAAIAVPAYQDYTGRAQATEGFSATAGLRTEISIYYAENGGFADIGNDALLTAMAGEIEGEYIGDAGNVSVVENGKIEIAFANGTHATSTLSLIPVQNKASSQIRGWQCTGLASEYLPSACE